MLVALNLRTAVAAVSPIVTEIGADIPLGAVGLGVLGMLPPVCFALFGLLTPLVDAAGRPRAASLLVAIVAIVVGHLLRAASTRSPCSSSAPSSPSPA